jgi:gamma-glutamyltranspeptidase
MAAHGMAATGHPLASNAALDVLKSGGNAVDAALCASAVLSVVKSYHCGLGGDAFGIFLLGEGAADLCSQWQRTIAEIAPPREFSLSEKEISV